MATILRRKKDEGEASASSPPKRARKTAAPGAKLSFGRRLLLRLDAIRAGFAPSAVRLRLRRYQRAIGLTKGGAVAVGAFIVLWLIARVVAGKGLYLFAYGVLLLVATAYMLAPKRMKLEGIREGLYPRAQEGDRLDVEVQLTAQRRIGTFILEERVPERLGRTVRVPVSKLPSGSTVSHRYGLRASRRGVYQIGPLVAVASDPLNLTQRETVVAEPFELLVHPRIELVSDRPLTRQFEDPPIRPPVSRPWPSGLEFYGMREYKPGDDLRRIVWRASARTGKIMVREAEQGITDHITIVLDTDRGSHSRDEDISESFETGVRTAASLAVRHLREGYEVRLEVNGGRLLRTVRGAQHQMTILDSLTRVDLERTPLTSTIRRLLSDPRRDAHMVLITPKLGPLEAAQLRLLLNKGVSILVVGLIWDDENNQTLAHAASLGCQVAGVHPGQDLTSALYHDMGAGNRL